MPLENLNQGEEEGEEQGGEGEGEEGQVSEDSSVEAPQEPVNAQAVCEAARALKISFKDSKH